MQFASTLVEYLVAGVGGLLWLVPLLNSLLGLNLKIVDPAGPMLLPLAYVLGLYIDATSSFLLRALKVRRLRTLKWWDSLFGAPYDASYDRTVAILAHTPELLAQTMQSYVSRDRIARCIALNAAIGLPLVVTLDHSTTKWRLFALVGIALLWSIASWIRLERLSSTFKSKALEALLQLPGSRDDGAR